jgi:hypothetical protein
MQNFNIEVLYFEPAPNSSLLEYFNKRLNELNDNPKVTEIKSAKLVLTYKKPLNFNTPNEYLFSTDIPGKGVVYHICEVIVFIDNVECIISNYHDVYFEKAIDIVINEALSRCFRY